MVSLLGLISEGDYSPSKYRASTEQVVEATTRCQGVVQGRGG
jgi:hypothetical protein